MRPLFVGLLFCLLLSGLVLAQTQPTVPVPTDNKVRVFVKGQGTTNAMTQGARRGGLWGGSRYDSIVDVHDESIELTKHLRNSCPSITVTLREDAAEYLVMLNRESKAKKGLFSKNSQVLVADKSGDVIWTKDVRQVASAAKDVCDVVSSKRTETKPELPKELKPELPKANPELQSTPEKPQATVDKSPAPTVPPARNPTEVRVSFDK